MDFKIVFRHRLKNRSGALAPKANDGPKTYYSSGNFGSITVTGNGKGIKCVAETIEHERYHLTIYDSFHGQKDGDNDGMPDSVESSFDGISSDPKDPDTYNVGGDYSGYGDEEIRCRNKELWANPGCQSKNKFGP